MIQIYRGISRCELHGIYPIVVGCWKNIKKTSGAQKEEVQICKGSPLHVDKHVAETSVNPRRTEGRNEIVQWTFFPDWVMVSPGNNSLYEKCVF